MSKPRLSLHMMARDVAPQVARALRSLRLESVKTGIDTELVLVDTGSTDGTPEVAQATCRELGFGFELVLVPPVARPDLYFLDLPEAYERKIPYPCTGKLLLRDWSVPRNLGLDRCQGDYVLKLDADDVYQLPPSDLVEILDRLEREPTASFVRLPYEVMAGLYCRDYVTIYTRIWHNRPSIRFREVCHENVDWCRHGDTGSLFYEWVPGLVPHFRDLRDGPRSPGRNYKVLLHEYERAQISGETPSQHVLMYLADEACRDDPELALDCLLLLGRGKCDFSPTELAWINTISGIAHETLCEGTLCEGTLGHYLEAVASYEKASVRWTRARLLLESLWIRKGECFINREGDLDRLVEINRQGIYPMSASKTEIVRVLTSIGKVDLW